MHGRDTRVDCDDLHVESGRRPAAKAIGDALFPVVTHDEARRGDIFSQRLARCACAQNDRSKHRNEA